VILSLLFTLSTVFAQPPPACTAEVEVSGVIGPASLDLFNRVESFAAANRCDSILLLVNTPGGSLETTRMIVEKILNSPMPYLCLISPSGGHAGSAGAIILQACHVNGGLHGTHLGAATPVAMGEDLPKDLRQKIMNDTRSWLESLTRLRGRSDKFGQDIILEAKSVTAEDALKLKALDFVGDSKAGFLKFASGRAVKLSENRQATVRTGDLRTFAHDTRYRLLALLTDPQFAYLLLMASFALIYFEITHPGTIVAGTLGGLGLIIALVALHRLDVEWGGLLLIALSVAMLVAEMFVTSFGVLGVGGLVAFVVGSIFLFDPVKSGGYRLPLALILPVALVLGGAVIGLSVLMLRTRRVKKIGGFEELIGQRARVTSIDDEGGMLELRGELWKFEGRDIAAGDYVKVKSHNGLVLNVEKES